MFQLKGADSEAYVEIGLASADAYRSRLQTEDGVGKLFSDLLECCKIDRITDETAFGALVTTLPKCIDAVRQGKKNALYLKWLGD